MKISKHSSFKGREPIYNLRNQKNNEKERFSMNDFNTRYKLVREACNYFHPILNKTEDFDKFIRQVDKELDEVKLEVINKCIEDFDEELRDSVPEGWTIGHKVNRKVTCVFGKLSFKRTLFFDQYGRKRYLADELLGIPYKSRFSGDAVIWLLKRVYEVSYGKTARDFTNMSGAPISKMGVWFMVQKQAALIQLMDKTPNLEPISQENICVETDGIFIALQKPERRKKAISRFLADQQRNKQSFELKCGCIYAGKVKENNRVRRINVDLLAHVGTASCFMQMLRRRIKNEYCIEDLNNLFYGSDGGAWCKNHDIDLILDAKTDCHNSLDDFHLMQCVARAFSPGNARDWIVNLLIRKKPCRALKAIDKMLPKIHGNKRVKVQQLRKYIANNYDLIMPKFNLGTMEATHAKIWAPRMKKIGGAWSKHGGHAMAVLLAHINSGKKLIPPAKQVFFSKKEMRMQKIGIERLGKEVMKQKRVGKGYEPPQAHAAKLSGKQLYIPGCFHKCQLQI